MIVWAALDLQQGEVVQLVGGHQDAVRVRWPDPVAVAEQWVRAGFRALHVIDLDAARGTGSNLHLVEAVIAAVTVPVQVGGGIRDEAAIERVLAAGASRVIAGTRALEDPPWRRRAASMYPGKLVVAADVRAGKVLTRGWTHQTAAALPDVITELNQDQLAGVLVTDVGREGRMTGIDADFFVWLCAASSHPVLAAGGIASNHDVELLQRAGAAGAVLGMSLYTGSIDVTALPGAQQ